MCHRNHTVVESVNLGERITEIPRIGSESFEKAGLNFGHAVSIDAGSIRPDRAINCAISGHIGPKDTDMYR